MSSITSLPVDGCPIYTEFFKDTDGDGLADLWEGKYFDSLVARPGDDPDHDGISNLDEFLEHTDDVDLDRVREWLPKLQWFRADAADPTYGVTPLHLASTPDSFWRPLFTDAQLEAHLDRLVADQQPDGGWAITWEPPGPASTMEYRGIVTVGALRTLKAYNRI